MSSYSSSSGTSPIFCTCYVGFHENPYRYRVRCQWGPKDGPAITEICVDEVLSARTHPAFGPAQAKAARLSDQWEQRLRHDQELRDRLTMESLL